MKNFRTKDKSELDEISEKMTKLKIDEKRCIAMIRKIFPVKFTLKGSIY